MWHRLWRRRCLLQETVCSDAGCGAVSGTLPLILTACRCMVWLSKGGDVSRCDCLGYGARHAVGTYRTDVSEERSASPFTFRTARCLPYPIMCTFGLYCELRMPYLLTQPFRYTWTLFYLATRTASPVPFRTGRYSHCRMSRYTQFSSVCCSYVVLVFCVFTEGAGIVCLPLADSRHIYQTRSLHVEVHKVSEPTGSN